VKEEPVPRVERHGDDSEGTIVISDSSDEEELREENYELWAQEMGADELQRRL